MSQRRREPAAVLLDPYHPYAVAFIERLWARHGVRTVAVHSRWRERLILEPRQPGLRGPAIAAHYMVGDRSWADVARQLMDAFDIVAVVPHEEGKVAPVAELARELGLDWAQPDVLPAFRDKSSLKQLVARNDPSVRINAFRLVASADEARHFSREQGLERVVLKPNDGSGNRDVAFVRASETATFDEYFATTGGSAVLVEEFVGGEEYYVNGQMDARGEPTVVAIARYQRGERNGRENVELGTITLSSGEPEFAVLRDYAESVMRATSLRRSPFHLEAKMDAAGPCLIEVAARLAGELGAFDDMWMHGPQLDLIDVATHYYLSADPYGPLPLDWRGYDSRPVQLVLGSSTATGRVYRVQGVDIVESLPSFRHWGKKPKVGDTVQPTRDLLSKPWIVTLGGTSVAELAEAANTVREVVRINDATEGPFTPRERLAAQADRASRLWGARPRASLARTRRFR